MQNHVMSIDSVEIGGGVSFANDGPLALIGGVNVIEGEDLVMEVAERFVDITRRFGIPYVFKASFDKANRSSMRSFRGPGLDEGLRILSEVKLRFGVPVLTDVHEPAQADAAAQVADVLQLPAFLARQTDLVIALARSGKPVNIKKPQFLAPHEMRHIIAKFAESGNSRLLLCERGTSFGYNNLVVDMLGIDTMKTMAPVIFDATHALQVPGGDQFGAGGRRQQAAALSRSAVAVGIAGLFVEAHPNPAEAKCDGPSALPLDALEPYLEQIVAIDRLVKTFTPIPIS